MQREPSMHYRSVETGGATIRLAEGGAGKSALVFLHYWGGSPRTLQAVIHRLEAQGRCIALDQRGWGESVAKDGRYDLDAMADDVEAAVRSLGLQRFVLVGFARSRSGRPKIAANNTRRPAILMRGSRSATAGR
jgi:pimeloyl-ACP methyl ester carboxylesterase